MNYELVMMMKPSLTEDEAHKESQTVQDFVKSLKGEVEKEDFWGKRKLAYAIKNLTDAYYTILDLKLETSQLKKVEDKVKSLPNVLRHQATVRN